MEKRPMEKRMSALALCALLAAGGCARTDDGSVVVPKALDMRRVDLGPLDVRHPGRMRPLERASVVVTDPLEPFPVAPRGRTVRRSDVAPNSTAKRVAGKAAVPQQGAGTPSATVACDTPRREGDRIRMSCE